MRTRSIVLDLGAQGKRVRSGPDCPGQRREEERRRLRRDLHDGLGPQLASHALALDVARELVPRVVSEMVLLREPLQAALAD